MNRIETYSRKATWPVAFALAAFVVAGCGGGGDGGGAGNPGPGVTDPVGAVCAGEACVNLGTASNYAILARNGISNVPDSAITGNIAVLFDTTMTGFSKTLDASGQFATSAQVTGRLHAADYAAPTSDAVNTAVADTGAAFVDADSKFSPLANENVNGGNLTGLNLVPGVYTWDTGVVVDSAGAVTLTGSATSVWVFQIEGGGTSLTMNPGAQVTLAGGALPQNVFWRTAGAATLDTNAHLAGIVLSGSTITLANGATVNGRLYASTTVALNANTVTRP